MSWWVWILVGVLLVAAGAFVWLAIARVRSGGTPPGPPIGAEPLSTHDEPVEDTAKVLDEKRHERTAHDVATDVRDLGRNTRGV